MNTQRPTAQDIIGLVLDEMLTCIEPIANDHFLVPSYFVVSLHPEAYKALEPALEVLKVRLKKDLQAKLNKLNEETFVQKRAKEWFGITLKGTKYELCGDIWYVVIGQEADTHVPLNFMALDIAFLPPDKKDDLPTHFKTQGWSSAYYAMGDGSRVTGNYGVLRFINEQNMPQTIPLYKPEITIGRFDEKSGEQYADEIVSTNPKVSRIHCKIGYNLMTNEVTLQDSSRYGTTLNGVRLQPNMAYLLKKGDQISLADALTLSFE